MPLLPQRRHRKASPQPNPSGVVDASDININSPAVAAASATPHKQTPPPISAGIRSYLATVRRRWISGSYDTTLDPSAASPSFNTLLPTTFSTASPSRPHKQRGHSSGAMGPSPSAMTCNNFLMGGHYYPGKDKKRRHMRRRTLWYRTFCSSPWRKVCSFLVMAYVLIWHVLVPTTVWLLEVGQRLSSDNPSTGASFLTKSDRLLTSGGWLLYDKTLLIPDSLEEEQARVIQIASQRAHTSTKQRKKRLRLLDQIAPEFFHRNDPQDKSQRRQQQQQQNIVTNNNNNNNNNSEERPKQFTGDAAKHHPTNRTRVVEDYHSEKRKRITQSLRRVVTIDHAPFRTIRTMNSLAANHSGCSRVPKPTSDFDWMTTLVIQTSADRLWIVNETCARWNDPIVAVVFVSSAKPELTTRQLGIIQEFFTKTEKSCPHLEVVQYMATSQESKIDQYPVNRLRNIGLDHVRTSHVMVMDVDFVPSKDLDQTIRSALKQQEAVRTKYPDLKLASQERQAIVVPAFERQPPRPCETEKECATYLQTNSSFLPKTFEELHKCNATQDCIVFQSKVNWDGHYSTRSQAWLERKWFHHDDDGEKRDLKSVQCFHSFRYEPYVVLRWCPAISAASGSSGDLTPVAPYYDERFYGYGKNKIELISHLRMSGYQFAILPEGFIIHNPHPESRVKETWNDREGSDLHSKMDKLYPEFLKELVAMYEPTATSTVKLCQK